MSLQDRLQAILTPCWHDAMAYGPRAPKGLLIVNAEDSYALMILDGAYKFTVFIAEDVRAGILEAHDLSPLANPLSILVPEKAAAYIVTQDLSIKPVIAPKDT